MICDTPPRNPQSTPPSIPPPKKKMKIVIFLPHPHPPPLFFFGHPKKRFSFVIGASIRIVQESQCVLFAVCCMPIMELQFLQIKFNPIKLFCFINCSGMYLKWHKSRKNEKKRKNYKHASISFSCRKNILWLNAKFDFMLFGQENNPKYIKKLFARKLSISGYGGIKNLV